MKRPLLNGMFKKFYLVLLSTALILSGCAKKPLPKRTQVALGTFVSITIADRDRTPHQIETAFSAAFEEINRIDEKFSSFDDASIVSIVNQNLPEQPMPVDEETFVLLKEAKGINELSDGAFDITVWPLVELWGFGKKKDVEIPADEQINAILAAVGSDKINLDQEFKTVTLSPGTKIDLSGIAKGFAVDKAIEALKQHKIKNALVDAGGDIYCLGKRGKKQPWNVGIQHPREKDALLMELDLTDQAVATSGDYERHFNKDDKVYSHIIDPRSGYSTDNSLISVTIFASSCTQADALATAVFVLGKEKGLVLIDSLEDTEAILIAQTQQGPQLYASQGLVEKLCLR